MEYLVENTSCVFTRELNKEPQQYSTNYLYKVLIVYAMTSLYLPSYPCPILISITYLLYVYLKATMPCLCALTSYSLISIIHAYTMCTLWEIHVPWCHPNSRLFLILLDCSRLLLTTLCLWYYVMWLPSHVPSLLSL